MMQNISLELQDPTNIFVSFIAILSFASGVITIVIPSICYAQSFILH